MPPSMRYYNQTAPFWDFVADLEGQGSTHPSFAGNRDANSQTENNNEQQGNPWAGGFDGWPFGGGFPHRGRRHGPPHHEGPHPHDHDHHRGPPPPPAPPGPPPAPDHPEAGPSEPRGPPPQFTDEPENGADGHHGPGPRRGPRGRCGGRGGWAGRGRGGPRGFPMGGAPPFLNNLAEMFQSQLFGDENNTSATKDKSEDFTPEVDIFDTETSYIIHASLPGAKKEDVGVNWNAEKSELSIAGVIYRPGDEELLKTLALDERKVGAFERKVRLGSRANPAQVDVDGIAAKMEDGVLRVEVPKLDSGYVEIKKVDIE